jgi:hypothetical protein
MLPDLGLFNYSTTTLKHFTSSISSQPQSKKNKHRFVGHPAAVRTAGGLISETAPRMLGKQPNFFNAL